MFLLMGIEAMQTFVVLAGTAGTSAHPNYESLKLCPETKGYTV